MFSLYDRLPYSRWRGLGAMCGKETATKMLNDAGFTKIEIRDLEPDPINCYYIARK